MNLLPIKDQDAGLKEGEDKSYSGERQDILLTKSGG